MTTPVKSRVSRHRAQLRAAGLRPVQIWVPDVRQQGFADECRRQSLALQGDGAEVDMQRWLEQVADTHGWAG